MDGVGVGGLDAFDFISNRFGQKSAAMLSGDSVSTRLGRSSECHTVGGGGLRRPPDVASWMFIPTVMDKHIHVLYPVRVLLRRPAQGAATSGGGGGGSLVHDF